MHGNLINHLEVGAETNHDFQQLQQNNGGFQENVPYAYHKKIPMEHSKLSFLNLPCLWGFLMLKQHILYFQLLSENVRDDKSV